MRKGLRFLLYRISVFQAVSNCNTNIDVVWIAYRPLSNNLDKDGLIKQMRPTCISLSHFRTSFSVSLSLFWSF
jgi:hypothetical protein